MKKTLFIFGPYDEFTLFIKFNSLIRKEKQKKEYDEIIAIVPYCAAGVISEADKILTVSHQFHINTESEYPRILNIKPPGNMVVAPGGREHRGYYKSGFLSLTLRYIKQNFDNYDVAMYTEKNHRYRRHLLHEFNIESIHMEPLDAFDIKRNPSSEGCVYHDQFVDVVKNLGEGMELLPFKEDYHTIKNAYGDYFDEKTYVIHSRGFKHKQPGVYNAEHGMNSLGYRPIIEKLMDEGYKFINVGFPPADLGIQHANYAPCDLSLSYSEHLSFCRLAAGWIMFSDAGGWLIHICSDLDIFSIGPEWSHFSTGAHGYKPLLENRLLRKELYTADLRNGTPKELYGYIRVHKPTIYNDKLPSLKQRVMIIDE